MGAHLWGVAAVKHRQRALHLHLAAGSIKTRGPEGTCSSHGGNFKMQETQVCEFLIDDGLLTGPGGYTDIVLVRDMFKSLEI